MTTALQAVSYLAPNWFGFYQAVVDYLQRSLAINIHLSQAHCDPLEDQRLLQDQLDLAFICGLPFIRHYKNTPDQLQLVAAPVMAAPRYCDRPIYFADVVVSTASTINTFADLDGKTFCYNDPGSNSGFNLMRWYLRQHDYHTDFLGQWVPSGSHQQSLQLVSSGQADCASIDSTVLEQAFSDDPTLANHIKVIATIGPSPMPPIVAARHLGTTLIQQIQSRLQTPDRSLQTVMTDAGVRRYVMPPFQAYKDLAAV